MAMDIQLHDNFSTFRNGKKDMRPPSNNGQNGDMYVFSPMHSQGVRANGNGVKKDKNCITVHLTCQPHSHPFQERWIPLPQDSSGVNDGTTQQPLKVGRLVARMKPASDNAIFDCKVLSRNHALLWRDDEGKIWLKDTKSSNGTFVNGQRLSKGAEESLPRELKTGDIIQFGVEVIENQMTHGCIIAQIGLIDPDGNERKRKMDEAEEGGQVSFPAGFINSSAGGPLTGMGLPGAGSIATQEQLYQINHYLQEASHREFLLEKKMEQLHNLLHDISDSSEYTWNLMLNEEKLLSKVKSLEENLAIYSSDKSHDSLKSELLRNVELRQKLQAEYENYLNVAGDEKLSLLKEIRESHSKYTQCTEECSLLQQRISKLEQDYRDLSHQSEDQNVKLSASKQKIKILKERTKSHETTIQSYTKERDSWREKEKVLREKIRVLEELNDERNNKSFESVAIDVQDDLLGDDDGEEENLVEFKNKNIHSPINMNDLNELSVLKEELTKLHHHFQLSMVNNNDNNSEIMFSTPTDVDYLVINEELKSPEIIEFTRDIQQHLQQSIYLVKKFHEEQLSHQQANLHLQFEEERGILLDKIRSLEDNVEELQAVNILSDSLQLTDTKAESVVCLQCQNYETRVKDLETKLAVVNSSNITEPCLSTLSSSHILDFNASTVVKINEEEYSEEEDLNSLSVADLLLRRRRQKLKNVSTLRLNGRVMEV